MVAVARRHHLGAPRCDVFDVPVAAEVRGGNAHPKISTKLETSASRRDKSYFYRVGIGALICIIGRQRGAARVVAKWGLEATMISLMKVRL
jgi:hypothetical protein